ncbi:Ulp1 family isopeptidase [Mesorhizobium shangrilense]|uniref:Ulp1 family isopeptidase n=1 Tax=Mesorhizobium shangrilense TaxID=460060 RepID=A0ABV2DRV8_9HYPH
MDPHKLDPSSVTAWRQVQHAVSQEQAGQAGQEGFEQHLGEARRAAAQIPAPGFPTLPDPFHPHLSQGDLSLIDAAVQADAARRKLQSKTVQNYVGALRRLGDYLGFRGETIEGLGHDSLVAIADAAFPKALMRPALEALRKFRERSAPAGQNNQSLIERSVEADVALPRLKPDTAQNYAAALRTSAKHLEPRRETINALDDDFLLAYADQSFRNDHQASQTLRRYREFGASADDGFSVTRDNGGGGASVASGSRQDGGQAAAPPVLAVNEEQIRRSPDAVGAEPVHSSVLAIDPDELQRPSEDQLSSQLSFDPDPAESFRPLSWRHDYLQAADELIGALLGSSLPPCEEVLINSEHDTAELRPAKRQRTLNDLQDVATEPQLSEIGNSGARVLMQAPTHQAGALPWEAQPMMQGSGQEHAAAPYAGGGVPMLGASVLQPGHSTTRHHHAPHSSVVDLAPPAPFELRDHSHSVPAPAGPAFARAEETSSAVGEAAQAARQALAWLREEMEEIEPMQDPAHQVGTSAWEARLMMPGDEHEYTPAPHAGGGGSMPPAVQPGQPTGVCVTGSTRPLYSDDASLILGFGQAIIESNGEHLLNLARWLFENNKPSLAARFDDESLTRDVQEFERKGGPSSVVTALANLKAAASGPILEGYPHEALVQKYQASAFANNVPSNTTRRYAHALTRFSEYLRENNKPGIAARIHEESLDEDVRRYKDSGGDQKIGAALVHLQKFLPRAALGREFALAAHPEGTVGMDASPIGDAAAQHSAPQEAFGWPEKLPGEGNEDDVVLPSSPVPTAHHHQAPDFGGAVRHSNWRHGDQRAPDELMGALDRSSLPPGDVATEPRLSEIDNSGARVLMQAPTHQAGALPWEAQPMMQGSGQEHAAAPYAGGGVPMLGASVLQPGHSTTRHHHAPHSSVVDLAPPAPFELRDHSHSVPAPAGPAFARAEETSSAVGEAAQAARQALAWLREEMEEIEPMQDPAHQVGTSAWGARLMMPGDEHEYTPAPHAGGGGSMPSAMQPDPPIVVSDGRNKRPLYSSDATVIEGLRSALRAGKAKESTVTRNVSLLFGFGRWLLENNRRGFAARLYHPSLNQDLKEYESKGGSSSVAGALGQLKKSAGGAAPMVGRTALNPDPDDAALIRRYTAALIKQYEAAPAIWPTPNTTRSYATVLKRFSQYLRENNKPGIAARIHEGSLDEDVRRYKDSGGEQKIGAALVHLQKFLPRAALGREIALAAHPEDTVGMDASPIGDAAAQHSAPQEAFGWPENLPGEGNEDDAVLPSSPVPTAHHHQAPDFGGAVRHLNWRHGDRRAPDELMGALDRSSLLPSEEVPLRYRPELAPKPSLRVGNSASPELFRPTMEQAVPASARAEETAPPVGETIDVSFAVPEDFSHRTQSAPETMLSSLSHLGLLPDAEQRVMSYDIRGERYTAVLGTGGPNDVQLIHHPRPRPMSEAALAAPARALSSDFYRGLGSLLDLPSTPHELRDDAHYAPVFPSTSSDAQIGASYPTASSHDRSGRVLGARQWLGDEHILRDYELLAQELQRNNPDLAARTRFVDPLVAHYHLRLGAESDASRAFRRVVDDQNGDDRADFLFVPVNDASATDPNRRGSHWSLLFVDRSERERPVAYHYDSNRGYNDKPAAELAARLGHSGLMSPGMAQQRNGYDCGVFVVDGTRALVRRLQRLQPDLLNLDNLVVNRQALQTRLRG